MTTESVYEMRKITVMKTNNRKKTLPCKDEFSNVSSAEYILSIYIGQRNYTIERKGKHYFCKAFVSYAIWSDFTLIIREV